MAPDAFNYMLSELKAMLEPPKKAPTCDAYARPDAHRASPRGPFQGLPACAGPVASQSYLALCSALTAELPCLLSHLNHTSDLVVRILAEKRQIFTASLRSCGQSYGTRSAWTARAAVAPRKPACLVERLEQSRGSLVPQNCQPRQVVGRARA